MSDIEIDFKNPYIKIGIGFIIIWMLKAGFDLPSFISNLGYGILILILLLILIRKNESFIYKFKHNISSKKQDMKIKHKDKKYEKNTGIKIWK